MPSVSVSRSVSPGSRDGAADQGQPADRLARVGRRVVGQRAADLGEQGADRLLGDLGRFGLLALEQADAALERLGLRGGMPEAGGDDAGDLGAAAREWCARSGARRRCG